MSKGVRYLFILMVAFHGFAFAAGEQELLSATARLRKLSLSFKGELPTEREYNEVLNKKIEVTDNEFFKRKAQEYSASPKFTDRMLEQTYTQLRLPNVQTSSAGSLEPWLKNALMTKTWNEILGSSDLAFLIQVGQFWFATMELVENKAIDSVNDIFKLNNEKEALEIIVGKKRAPLTDEQKEIFAELKSLHEELREKSPKTIAAFNPNVRFQSQLGILIAAVHRLEDIREITTVEEEQYIRKIGSLTTRFNQAQLWSGAVALGSETLKTNLDLVLRIVNDIKESGLVYGRYGMSNEDEEKLKKVYEKHHMGIMQSVKSLMSNQRMGVTATKEFSDRFNQTPFSQSAAYYRIYFCDDMKAVAIAKGGLNSLVLNGIFRGNSQLNQPIVSDEKRHASDPKCQTCHRKMDNAKKVLSEGMSKGDIETIKYDTFDGIEQSFNIGSPTELIPKTQQQYTYKQCQAKSLWGWIIGENIPLSKSKYKELVEMFDSSRSLREYLIELSQQSAFYTIPLSDKIVNFESVRPIFQRCNSCHQGESLIPNYTQLPFSMFGSTDQDKHEEHIKSVQKIIEMTAAFHGGRDAKMPSKDSGWRLDKDLELDLIAKWVLNKAPDSKGRPTLSDSELQHILSNQPNQEIRRIKTLDFTLPAFRKTWRRYLSNRNVFSSVFSQAITKEINECFESYSPEIFGGYNFMTGKFNLNGMAATTLNAVMTCVENKLTTVGTSGANSNFWFAVLNFGGQVFYAQNEETILTSNVDLRKVIYSVAKKVEPDYEPIGRSNLSLSSGKGAFWKKLEIEQQREIVTALVRNLVGPDVLDNEQNYVERLMVGLKNYAKTSGKGDVDSLSADEAIKAFVILITSDEEFLSY